MMKEKVRPLLSLRSADKYLCIGEMCAFYSDGECALIRILKALQSIATSLSLRKGK